MTHNPQSPMQAVVYAILQQHHLTEVFNTATDFHLRIENKPYMALVIERHANEVSLAHYFTQNGDAMRDPEETFNFPDWSPTSITQDPIGHYACVDDLPAESRQRLRLLADLTVFARTWAQNLEAQGFAREGVKVSSLTHQATLDRQTLTSNTETEPDAHLEAQYEDQFVSDHEDYEPSPYDGTYSEM